MDVKKQEWEIATEDGLLRFLISDSLEEYRVKTLLTKEPETISWIDSWSLVNSDAPTQFWDIGSNIGMYTLYAAVKNPKLHVISIEPFFKNFIRLKANIYLNKLENITPLYFALGRNSGLVEFFVQDERFGASGNMVILHDKLVGDGTLEKGNESYNVKEKILQVSGDDLLKLNLRPPNYLKIDVDGLELGIIEGMKGILKSDHLRSVLIEVNSKEELAIIKSILSNCGFSPDDNINLLKNHSRKRRSQNVKNTAENWVFTKA